MVARDFSVRNVIASNRPLVVRFGALGDMVILTVLIRHLYARFGQPVDILASGAWTRQSQLALLVQPRAEADGGIIA
jgi:hypothetical protein